MMNLKTRDKVATKKDLKKMKKDIMHDDKKQDAKEYMRKKHKGKK